MIMTHTALRRPSIVNAKSEVLKGHCRRSNGGLCYHGWDECSAIPRHMDDSTKRILGQQGRRYVRENHSWNRVESGYLRATAALLEPALPAGTS